MKRRIKIETVIHEKRPVNIDNMIGSTSDSSWPELYELNKNGAINRPSYISDAMTKRDTDKEFISDVKPIAKQLYRQGKRQYSQQCYIAREKELRLSGMSKKDAREQANKERNEYIASQRQAASEKGHLAITKERSEDAYIIANKQVMYDAKGNVLNEHIEYLQDYAYRKIRASRSGGYDTKRFSLGASNINMDSPVMTHSSVAQALWDTRPLDTGIVYNTVTDSVPVSGYGTVSYIYEPGYKHVMGIDNDNGRYRIGDACILRIGEAMQDSNRHYDAKALQDVIAQWQLRDLQAYFRFCL